ncbi:unnamed protein product [Clonostachys solani]|uniref:Uncharacterized protein n=1 Tax=Clonostachys solani TaxID=160281 RepID=A0A9P0END8_9HYPO|nr:unnamed protein product [Clonostachys solani]
MTLIRLTDTRSPEQSFSAHESKMSNSRQSMCQPERRGDDQPTVPRQARTTPREVPDKATAKARIMPFALSTIFPLTKHSQPYISPDFLKAFPNIKVCRDKLSFDDGTLPPAYEQFLQPLPRDHVEKLLRHTQPWRDDGVLSDFIPDETIKNLIIPLPFSTSDRWGDNFQDARALWRALDEHMGRNGTGDPEQKTIIKNYTYWKFFREDCLSTSEMQSVLWLASEAATDPAYMQHWVFPVTIVSACMFNVRIVQAIVRLGSNTVEIRKSDIMDLSPGLTDEATQDRFRRLLAWLLGTPMGNTTTKS